MKNYMKWLLIIMACIVTITFWVGFSELLSSEFMKIICEYVYIVCHTVMSTVIIWVLFERKNYER